MTSFYGEIYNQEDVQHVMKVPKARAGVELYVFSTPFGTLMVNVTRTKGDDWHDASAETSWLEKQQYYAETEDPGEYAVLFNCVDTIGELCVEDEIEISIGFTARYADDCGDVEVRCIQHQWTELR